MPGVSRNQRAEAKYNVTLDFPQLGLHQAAATGNLGLVKYALDHGQPINSVLDGVLPLHVACSGGNDQVVQLLIDNGADVNAPRLPRRYSSDKSRDSSAPIVGTSGSTPLHFACANGHTSVVNTLLRHGAHPDRPDKHGITPEMIARQNGWIACAEALNRWTYEKDKDLRDKEVLTPSRPTDRDNGRSSSKDDTSHVCIPSRECCRKLRMKGSTENSLNRKARPSLSPSGSTNPLPDSVSMNGKRSLHSPIRPQFSMGISKSEQPPPRRPSLPHVFEPNESSFPSGKPHSSRSRRPCSAGTDAEQSSTTTSHKLKSKISLLSIFKKSYSDLSGASATPDSTSGLSSLSSVPPSHSPSPVPGQSAGSTPSHNSSQHHSFDVSMSSVDSPDRQISAGRLTNRVFSEDNGTSGVPSTAVDLHHALSNERLRFSRGSPSTSTDTGVDTSASQIASAVRPGILRPHARSSSFGLSGAETRRTNSFSQSSARALRFDSDPVSPVPSSISRRTGSQSSSVSSMRLKISHSVSSFRGDGHLDSPRSPLGVNVAGGDPDGTHPQSIDGPNHALDSDLEEEGEDEEYGEPIQATGVGLDLGTGHSPLRRRYSESRLSTSSSALPSPEVVEASPSYEFPFSISRPPQDLPFQAHPASPSLRVHGVDNRLRGDSLSSTSTTGSAYPVSASSIGVATPATLHGQGPDPQISSPSSTPLDLPAATAGYYLPTDNEIQKKTSSVLTSVTKAPRVPLDIDIHSISSHAQAEALVQRAQQRIFEAQEDDVDCPSLDAAFVAAGRTPLSAKLAAYGESLAIKKKFTQEEEIRALNRSGHRRAATAELLAGEHNSLTDGNTLRGLDRKFSLEERPHGTPRRTRVRRPQTSEGVASPAESFLSGKSTALSEEASTPSQPTSDSAPARRDRFTPSHSASCTPPYKLGYTLKAPDNTMGVGLVRSRTPDPLDFSPSMGAPLSRVSTAPTQDCVSNVMATRNVSTQGRQAARANKLVKMGFSAPDPPTAPSVRSAPAAKARFGIKTLVQTLKGKT